MCYNSEATISYIIKDRESKTIKLGSKTEIAMLEFLNDMGED